MINSFFDNMDLFFLICGISVSLITVVIIIGFIILKSDIKTNKNSKSIEKNNYNINDQKEIN